MIRYFSMGVAAVGAFVLLTHLLGKALGVGELNANDATAILALAAVLGIYSERA